MYRTIDDFVNEYEEERQAEVRRQEYLQQENNRLLMLKSGRELQEAIGADLYEALNMTWRMYSDNTCYAEFKAYNQLWRITPITVALPGWRFHRYQQENSTRYLADDIAHVIISQLAEAKLNPYNPADDDE